MTAYNKTAHGFPGFTAMLGLRSDGEFDYVGTDDNGTILASLASEQKVTSVTSEGADAIDDSAAVEIVAANADRQHLVIKNAPASANTVYIGTTSSVTDANGYPLVPGDSFETRMSGTAYYARCASTETASVRHMEV